MSASPIPPSTRGDVIHDRARARAHQRARQHATRQLHKLDIDIDKYVNPYLVSSATVLHALPNAVSQFLGYRDTSPLDMEKTGGKAQRRKRGPRLRTRPVPDVVRSAWVLVSTFAGLILVMCVMKYAAVFNGTGAHGWLAPEIVPSWAATAILIYNAVESPLGQPRNTFFGTLISSFVGICITKLFMLNKANEEYLWVCGALNVGVASIAMAVTKTVHPPGGAAALISAIDDTIRDLGWYYLVVQIVTGLLMLSVACLFNNVQRRYPLYWWTPTVLKASGFGRRHEKREAPAELTRDTDDDDDEEEEQKTAVSLAPPPPAAAHGSGKNEPAGMGAAQTVSRGPETRRNSLTHIKTPPGAVNDGTTSTTMGSPLSKLRSHGRQPGPQNSDDDDDDYEEDVAAYDDDDDAGSNAPGQGLSRTLSRAVTRAVTDSTSYTQVIGTRPRDTGDLVLDRTGTITSARGAIDTSDDVRELHEEEGGPAVVILASHFALPRGLELTEEERVLLGRIQEQLQALAQAQQDADNDNNV